MAFENRGLDVPFNAGEDLSSAQYRFLELNSNGDAVIAGVTGNYAIGILQDAPVSGAPAEVRVDGISKLAMGSTGIYGVTGVAVNTFLSPDSNGRGVGETGAGFAPKYAKARMLDSTFIFDKLGTVEIVSANPA